MNLNICVLPSKKPLVNLVRKQGGTGVEDYSSSSPPRSRPPRSFAVSPASPRLFLPPELVTERIALLKYPRCMKNLKN